MSLFCKLLTYKKLLAHLKYIAEAISMANRIIVLSNRPATIKKIFDINLTDSSTPIENRKCREFATYYQNIWKELDIHV